MHEQIFSHAPNVYTAYSVESHGGLNIMHFIRGTVHPGQVTSLSQGKHIESDGGKNLGNPEHVNSTQKRPRWPSCCEVTVLSTEPPRENMHMYTGMCALYLSLFIYLQYFF